MAGPGFINFYLKPIWANEVIFDVLKHPNDYGRSSIGNGKKIQVEFVSANPTGPMHMGNARGAALGDALAAVLKMAGYDVTKEFYINDAGNQIQNFGLSLEARYLQLLGREGQIPEGGYHGEDITEHMRHLIKQEGERFLDMDSASRRAYFIEYAIKKNIQKMKDDLKKFGVHFDIWYSEQTLHDSGKVDNVIKLLTDKGYTYEKTEHFGLKPLNLELKKMKSNSQNGLTTYFASDIAYHKDKFDRGFDTVINIWGADHHGHIARMKGALEALDYEPDKLTVIIMQLVRLYRNGEIARMSKRTGRSVTLVDIVDEVGKDAARFFFNLRSADTHLDFDLDLAIKESDENPVYYVQYAHARISSILRQAKEQGVKLPDIKALSPEEMEKYASILVEESEIELIDKITDFPGEIKLSAEHLAPYRITVYSMEMASIFHSFYNKCRVLTEDENLTTARLILVMAVQQVLKCPGNIGNKGTDSM